METTHTYCRVCEPACGLIADVDAGRLVKLRPDRDHPVSKGFACPKGLAGVEIHHDPDRLNHPTERVDGNLVERTWQRAIDGIATDLQRVVDRWGPNGVAVYMGNPASFNSLLGIGMPELFRRLGVTRKFCSSTQDCVNKYAASTAVYGAAALHPLPDVRHAEVLLLIGSNWRASKGSFISVPNAYGELMAAAARGARIWFVNPRDTESSGDRTGPTVQIKPDTDVYFLAAVLSEIERTLGFDAAACREVNGIAGLRAFVRRYPPERVADVCGVPAATIIEVARAFATAGSAAVHMSTGVNMGRQGTLAYWLVQMLSLVTGNLDRVGGNVPGSSPYDLIAKTRADYDAGGLDGEFGAMRVGDIPGGLLAEHVLDAAEPVRALFVFAGNPLLSVPGEARLREAFDALELLVSVDIYPNATSEHAHWLLPATDQFERADVGMAVIGMQHQAYVQATPPVVEPLHERREEWWMLAQLARAMGLPSALDADDPDEARWSRIDHMLAAGGLSRAQLAAAPQGIVGEPGLQPGRLRTELVHTADGRIDACPAGFAAPIHRCEELFLALVDEPEHQLKLISRRGSRMQNSWYANVEGMKAGKRDRNRLGIHPVDAERLEVLDGGAVTVTSAWGEVVVDAEIDPTLRPGVVSMEHGWGPQRGMRLGRERPGVNVNRLTPHGPGSFEPASNQQQLTGIAVEVVPVAT